MGARSPCACPLDAVADGQTQPNTLAQRPSAGSTSERSNSRHDADLNPCAANAPGCGQSANGRRIKTAAELAAFAARAHLLRRLNRADEALHDLEASVARDPGKVERLEQLAVWYVERRAWAAALGVWRRLLARTSSTTDGERARIQVLALMSLAASTDVVQLAGARDDWARVALRHLAGQAAGPPLGIAGGSPPNDD
jgi:hypothetical protein